MFSKIRVLIQFSLLLVKESCVGNLGSGAATASRRFFESMGVWDKIEHQYLGYAAGAIISQVLVDALWLFRFTAAVVSVAEQKEIKLDSSL